MSFEFALLLCLFFASAWTIVFIVGVKAFRMLTDIWEKVCRETKDQDK